MIKNDDEVHNGVGFCIQAEKNIMDIQMRTPYTVGWVFGFLKTLQVLWK